jgi:hypothetical protein
MKACQPQEQQLLNKYQAQTLCAKVKAIYESAGKENGVFFPFSAGLFDTRLEGGVPRSLNFDQQLNQAASFTPLKRPLPQPNAHGDVLSNLIHPAANKVLSFGPSMSASSDQMFGGGLTAGEDMLALAAQTLSKSNKRTSRASPSSLLALEFGARGRAPRGQLHEPDGRRRQPATPAFTAPSPPWRSLSLRSAR